MYYNYKRNSSEIIKLNIPYKEELIPILYNIHINNNQCGYKPMINNIIKMGFYWESFTRDVTLFLNKCEVCNGQKNKKKIKNNNTSMKNYF